jgi:hypothetical protein
MALISPKSVERMYGVSTADLARWRQTGEGPEYYRISPRVVRYGTDDLEKWFHDPANAHLHDFPVSESAYLCSA